MADNRRKNSMRPHTGLFILVGICLFLMLVSSFSEGFNNAVRGAAATASLCSGKAFAPPLFSSLIPVSYYSADAM